MTQYIQYDENGNITATVISDLPAPAHDRQIVLDDAIDVTNKIVGISTGQLIDIPAEE